MTIEVKHFLTLSGAVTAAEGFFHRVRLGLSSNEIARIKQVCFHLNPNSPTQFIQAVSGDPDEEANLGAGAVTNDQNLLAVRSLHHIGTVLEGPLVLDVLVMPIPGEGLEVAGDVVYLMGVAVDVANNLHGCSVYYERKKASIDERENLIMSQR